MTRFQVLVWHKAFKEGRESAEDEEKVRSPTTTKTPKESFTKSLSQQEQRLTPLFTSKSSNDFANALPASSRHRQQLDPALRQRAQSHDEDCAGLFLTQKKVITLPQLP